MPIRSFDGLEPTSMPVMGDIVSGSLAFLMVRVVNTPAAKQTGVMRQGVYHMLLSLGVSKAKAKGCVQRALERLPLA